MTAPPTETATFLSLVAWPEGWRRDQVAQLLAESGGLDPATVRMRLGQAAPMVLGEIEPAAARRCQEALVERGGDAFTFTLETLAAPGAALAIKDLRIVEGALELHLWNGLGTTLPTRQVQVLVRAQLRTTVTERRERPRLSSMAHRTRTRDSIKAQIESSVRRRVRTAYRLDLHTTGGVIYRIAAERFRFEALGALRRHGPKANTDRLTELLHHLAPEAVLDTYYALWRPPPGHQRLRLPGDGPSPGERSFEFYSRWAALTYRHVMGV